MSDEVIPTGQGISVVEEIDKEATDTYAKAREVTDAQIAKEQAVHDANDAIESDVLGLWDEFIEIPYGNLTMRLCSDMPKQKHDNLMRFAAKLGEATDIEHTETMPLLTLGLYKDDIKVHETNEAFWENTSNWSDLKVKQILGAYMKNYKKEVEATTSFLGE